MTANDLVVSNLALVSSIAGSIYNKIGRAVPFDDLKSEGTIGLIQAARSFDGVRSFRGFAKFRIAGQMRDFLRTLDCQERRQREKFQKSRTTEQALAFDAVSPRFVALTANVDKADKNTPEDSAIQSEQREINRGIVRRLCRTAPLTANERAVVRDYFLKDKPLRQIGKSIGVNESRVSQIKRAAIIKLRAAAGEMKI